jgi:guanylate kinase
MNPKGTKGKLYIIAAASGTGKTSLAEALSQTLENIKISISHTTRSIRANERANQHYFFVTNTEFEKLIAKQAFLEYARIFSYYYGTSRQAVEENLNAGFDVILDIDWQGARQVRDRIECTTIFLLPPSYVELRLRLEKRKRENSGLIEERLSVANSEISHYKEFDYIVINDKFENALLDLRSIVHSNRLRLENQIIKYDNLLEELSKNNK